MVEAVKNVQGISADKEIISILLVSPSPHDEQCVKRILHHHDWQISRAASVGEAAERIRSERPSLVISERDLPDGTWKEVFAAASAAQPCPLLLVASRHADDNLWAEVLNLGCYDVLLKPFDNAEVTRVIGMAWRHWSAQSLAKPLSSLGRALHSA